jgi:hypothetical protein
VSTIDRRPVALLPGAPLEFDPSIMRRNLQLGFDRAGEEIQAASRLFAAASR